MTDGTMLNRLFFLALVLFTVCNPFLNHLLIIRLLGLFREKSLRQKGAIMSITWGFLPLGALFFLWSCLIKERNWANLFWSGTYLFSIYILFAYAYFHLFNMSETARRVRILTGSPNSGKLTKSEVAREYTCRGMVSIRLQRLLSLKELRLEGRNYRIDRGVLIFPAKVVSFLHKLIFPGKKDG